MLPSAKLHSYIGFCIRSGHVVWGADQVVRSRGAHLVIADREINRTSRGELERWCATRKVPLVWTDEELIRESTHKHNCKCVALTDVNLAKAAYQELTRIGEEKE